MNRILVDLLGYTGERGGTETYARALLARLPARMPDTEFIALANRPAADAVRDFFPGEVKVVGWVGGDRVSWALGAMTATARIARRLHADLVWCPSNFGPVSRTRVPLAVTIHDAIYDEVPGSGAERLTRAVTSWLMRRAARSATAVLTVSDSAATSISAQFAVPANRIHRVYNGASAPTAELPSPDLIAQLGVPTDRSLVLSTGNRMPHKNFVGLLMAVAQIPPGERPFVVIPGSHGSDPLRQSVTELGLETDVLLPGWVHADALEALYHRADLYACPSLAEGFGLPVVDALVRGCRVVANDIPVLREVGSDYVAYADARDPQAFAEALRAALSAQPTAQQAAAAQTHARTFTWDTSAEHVAAVLARVMEIGGVR